MFQKFVLITGALDILLGIGVAAGGLADPQPESFVTILTMGAFLLFAGAALMWSAQDLGVRSPIVFWQGLVRLVAVVSSLYAIPAGLAGSDYYGVAAFDGVVCAVYFVGTCRLTGASPFQLLVGKTGAV
jgi:hypothetical protein